MPPRPLRYADAGVHIDTAAALIDRIRPAVKATARPGADAELGGFGGVFDLAATAYQDPILVAATDGVGTKLRLAIEHNQLSGLGQDLVAMCVNDLVVQGAEPLFFLDYFATGLLAPETAAQVILGIADACREVGAALIGGETAEMPGFYAQGDFDLAGFAVGAVEREALLPHKAAMQAGDCLLALPSNGLHANGFSLLRAVLERRGSDLLAPPPFEAPEARFIDLLLRPTELYVAPLLKLHRAGLLKGAAHITGGGWVENIPRMLPPDLTVDRREQRMTITSLYRWLAGNGEIAIKDMIETFNCGVGMVLVIAADKVKEAQGLLPAEAFPFGVLAAGADPDWGPLTEDFYPSHAD